MRYKFIWATNKLGFAFRNWNRDADRGSRPGTSHRRQKMDVTKILADLRQERAQIEEAILSLERLAAGRGARRGRPPAWMSEAKKRGRPLGSKNKQSLEEGPDAEVTTTEAMEQSAAA
jgi:hypothetical protein